VDRVGGAAEDPRFLIVDQAVQALLVGLSGQRLAIQIVQHHCPFARFRMPTIIAWGRENIKWIGAERLFSPY
jgi:hypothetical protein